MNKLKIVGNFFVKFKISKTDQALRNEQSFFIKLSYENYIKIDKANENNFSSPV